MARQDDRQSPRLVAYLVGALHPAPQPRQLREFVRERLPDYMVPAAFIWLDALPLTDNGKIDRERLPAPAECTASAPEAYASPETLAEKLLAAIWSKVLHRERLGVDDNFFELGGNSILSIQVSYQAKQAGLAISPRLFLEHQTIRQLAAAASLTAADQGPAVVAVSASVGEQDPLTGSLPLTPI